MAFIRPVHLLMAVFLLFFFTQFYRPERPRSSGKSSAKMGPDIPREVFPLRINGTRVYSPLSLCAEWDTLVRFIIMVLSSCFGSTMNGYFISSFFWDQRLQRLRHAYLVFLGLADFLITGGVIPIATIVFMSGHEEIVGPCHFVQFLASTSIYSYSIFYLMVAGEVFIRVCLDSKLVTGNRKRKYIIIASVAILTFVISAALSYIGVYWGLDYDYCERRHFGNIYFRTTTFMVVHVCTFFWIIWALESSSNHIEENNIFEPRYNSDTQYDLEVGMIKLHMWAYAFHIVSWLPFMYILIFFPYIHDSVFYGLAWLGISRSLVTSIFYGMSSVVLSNAFQSICSYCCFKNKNNRYQAPHRRRRGVETGEASRGVISTHMMQHMCRIQCSRHASPRRATTSTQQTIEL